MHKIRNKPIPLAGTSLGKGRNRTDVEIYCNTSLRKAKSAFTLVELIIVITILAILATIGFMSFQSYTMDARDTNRITSIDEIRKGLEIYQIKNSKLPIPTNSVTITASGVNIGYEGIFGKTESDLIKMISLPIDPLDNTGYIYSINSDKNKFQLLTFLENSVAYNTSLINKIYAIDYSNRKIKTLGDNIGIILDENNIIPTGTGFDILKESNFKIILNRGEINEVIISQVGLKVDSQYPGCPEKDIAIPTPNGIKILSSCNIGATSTDINSENSWGYTYHWGNNYGFSLSGTVIVSVNDETYDGDVFQYGPQNPFERNIYVRTTNNLGYEVHPHSWFKLDNGLPNQLWGANSNNKQDKKGPCPDGYYIPKQEDWEDVINSNLFNSNDGIILNEYQNFFASILKLPYTKWRSHSSGISALYRGYYHTSSPLNWRNGKEWDPGSGYGGGGYNRVLLHNKETLSTKLGAGIISYSSSIRCFKIY